MFVGIWIHLSFVGRARRTARSALGLLYNIRRFFILRQWFKCEHFANCPPTGHRPFLLYRRQTVDLPPIQRHSRWRRLYALGGRGQWPPSAAGSAGVHRRETPCPRRGAKGDRTPSMVSCPLSTPLTFLCADTSEMCSETGVTGARFRASGRFGDAVMP